jgi:hypothetical protein
MVCRVLGLLFLLLSFPILAADVVLKPNHPKQYVVVKGDTLWDISGKFLQYPWHWPDIWQVNPQVKNPHLIYPGDTLSLVYRDGKPYLELARGIQSYKLSPQARETLLDEAIPTIPYDVIKPFLNRPLVVGEEVLEMAPYVVASTEERLISAAGDKVYARGIEDAETKGYSIFTPGSVYKDPETGEVLGYEAIYNAEGRVTRQGDPVTIMLSESTREVSIGDRLMPVVEDDYAMNFMPHSPDTMPEGQIISIYEGVSQIGQYEVVIINRGQREGLEVGHVLSVYQAGDVLHDSILAAKDDDDISDEELTVTLPDEYAGVVLVFKVFEKVSYAIVMKATRAIHVNDTVSAPQ